MASIVYTDDKMVRGVEIRELYDEAGWALPATRKPEEIEESVRHAYRFWTARDGARLVGLAAALSDRSYYTHITELLVRERFRDRGVQSELLRRLLASLGEARVITIFAEPDAAGFYREFGFTPTAGGMLLQRS